MSGQPGARTAWLSILNYYESVAKQIYLFMVLTITTIIEKHFAGYSDMTTLMSTALLITRERLQSTLVFTALLKPLC